MQRDELINGVRGTLEKVGFTVSKPLNMRSISFDIVARRDKTLLLIKILSNVDAFSKDNSEEVKTLAEALGGSPLLVGERSGAGEIEQGIVYSRFNVPIISLSTLKDLLLEAVPPFIFAAPGGLYVKLDSDLLKRLREEKSISLGNLAEVAGVSRRTIQMYETGMGAMIDVAIVWRSTWTGRSCSRWTPCPTSLRCPTKPKSTWRSMTSSPRRSSRS